MFLDFATKIAKQLQFSFGKPGLQPKKKGFEEIRKVPT